MMTEETYLRDLTVGEFRGLMRAVISEQAGHKRTVQGLSGLADLLGCSLTTVKRYRALLATAIAQRGRTIIVDADRALSLWAGRKSF